VDRNNGAATPRTYAADLEHATVRELILQLARVEEEGIACETRTSEQAQHLAERGRAIVRELRSRSPQAERNPSRPHGGRAGT
jgi:hypothetical protein